MLDVRIIENNSKEVFLFVHFTCSHYCKLLNLSNWTLARRDPHLVLWAAWGSGCDPSHEVSDSQAIHKQRLRSQHNPSTIKSIVAMRCGVTSGLSIPLGKRRQFHQSILLFFSCIFTRARQQEMSALCVCVRACVCVPEGFAGQLWGWSHSVSSLTSHNTSHSSSYFVPQKERKII